MESYLAFALSSSSAHELSDRTRAVATEVFEGAAMVESVLEEVTDLLVVTPTMVARLSKKHRMYGVASRLVLT
jgi:hypothetical protein